MKYYSPIQAFFWLFAGSEIHILKDCKNDYNRHASIGFVLFMTTIFATLSGFSAGYFFSHGNISISIFFALLWAMLIYSIDRSMVVSLKKKSETEKLNIIGRLKYYFIPFGSRAIVGIMIGFFMAIPLEIIVFQDNIKVQIDEDNKQRILEEAGFVNTINNLGDKKNLKSDSEKKKEELDSLLQTNCPLPQYQEALNDYNTCKPLADRLNNIYLEVQQTLNKTQKFEWVEGKSYETQEYKDARFRRNKTLNDYRTQKKMCDGYKANASKISNDWRKGLTVDRNRADSTASSLGKQILTINSEADSSSQAKAQLLAELNGFTRQYEALTHASSKEGNDSLLFLLWLIRLIFIGIEILPTLTKIMTPIGDYDNAVEAKEEEYKEHLDASKKIHKKSEEDRVKSESDISEGTETKRKEIETALNNKILEEVARVQAEVATEMLKEWEKHEKEKSSSKVAEFMKSK